MKASIAANPRLAAAIPILSVLLGVAGCDRGSSRETRPENFRSDQESASSAKASSRELSEKLSEVDSWYPRPKVPNRSSRLHSVIGVSSSGEIVVSSGLKFELDGLSCTPEGIAALSTRLLEKTSKVSFVDEAAPVGNPPKAQIWVVTSAGGHPSYELIGESAILSGWCKPSSARSLGLSNRYRAIARVLDQSP